MRMWSIADDKRQSRFTPATKTTAPIRHSSPDFFSGTSFAGDPTARPRTWPGGWTPSAGRGGAALGLDGGPHRLGHTDRLDDGQHRGVQLEGQAVRAQRQQPAVVDQLGDRLVLLVAD